MHVTKNLPVVIVGGGIGPFRGDRHLRYPVDTPMMNLYLTMLETLGVSQNGLGDSTGKLDLLSV